MCVGYEFPNTFPEELKPYIPHEHVKVRALNSRVRVRVRRCVRV